jgi:hypothetical protein
MRSSPRPPYANVHESVPGVVSESTRFWSAPVWVYRVVTPLVVDEVICSAPLYELPRVHQVEDLSGAGVVDEVVRLPALG